MKGAFVRIIFDLPIYQFMSLGICYFAKEFNNFVIFSKTLTILLLFKDFYNFVIHSQIYEIN